MGVNRGEFQYFSEIGPLTCLDERNGVLAISCPLDIPDMVRVCLATSEGISIRFHYLIGLITSSLNVLQQYVEEHMDPQEDLICVTYCTVDAFSLVDVRTTFELVKGSLQSHTVCVDSEGQESEVGDIWVNLGLSSCLRSLNPLKSPKVQVVPSMLTPFFGQEFVRLAALTFEMADHLGMANLPLHGTNILCEFLADFLVNTFRLNWGHQFFEARAPVFAGAGVHLSRFMTNNVGKFIQNNHKHPPTLHRAATLLLARNEGLREALELSWLAVRAAPYIASYWMTLARAYVSLAYYEHALCAFNSIPFKKPVDQPAPLPGFLEMSAPLKTHGQNAHPWLFEPPTTYLLYHWPKWPDCPLEWLSHRQTKRLLIYSGDLQGFGFNRMLIDRKLFHPVCTEAEVDFYQGKDSNLHERTLEYDRMSLIHQQVYGHLVDLIKKLGWDAMGDIWFRVFVTQEQGIDGQTFEGVPGDPLLPPLAKRMSGDDFHKIFSMLNADFDEFANVDVELAALRSDLLRSTPLQNWVHAHPPLVWAHWGALCKRLKRIKPMELCFRILLLRGFCPKAAVHLIEIYQEHSMVCEALIILGALLNFVMVAGKIQEVSRVPLYVNALGASLLESFGEEAVKTALGESPFICGHQGLVDFIEMNVLNGTAEYPLA